MIVLYFVFSSTSLQLTYFYDFTYHLWSYVQSHFCAHLGTTVRLWSKNSKQQDDSSCEVNLICSFMLVSIYFTHFILLLKTFIANILIFYDWNVVELFFTCLFYKKLVARKVLKLECIFKRKLLRWGYKKVVRVDPSF